MRERIMAKTANRRRVLKAHGQGEVEGKSGKRWVVTSMVNNREWRRSKKAKAVYEAEQARGAE
jgi:hypothetical protein